jgi:hypothetical protein
MTGSKNPKKATPISFILEKRCVISEPIRKKSSNTAEIFKKERIPIKIPEIKILSFAAGKV